MNCGFFDNIKEKFRNYRGLQGIADLIVFVFIAWLFSENPRQVKIRIIIAGIFIQIIRIENFIS